MTKENLYLIINTVILTALSILFLIVYTSLVPKTPEDKLFNQVIELKNTVVIEQVPTGNYSIIATRSRAINNAGEQVGLVYKGIIRNGYTYTSTDTHGLIEILVGITPDDRVFVQIVTLKQTSTYVGGIQNYVYEYFRDIDYLEVEGLPVVDLEEPGAGATASDSTGAIKSLVQRIVDLHFEIVRDQFKVWYGEGYSKANDDAFIPTALVVNREVVRNSNNAIIGYVYKLIDSGEYYSGDVGSISIYIAFDIDGKVIGILLPDDEYGHSKGSFKNRNYNYLQEFVGATAEEFADIQTEKADIAAGASNTQKVVDRLLMALSEVILG